MEKIKVLEEKVNNSYRVYRKETDTYETLTLSPKIWFGLVLDRWYNVKINEEYINLCYETEQEDEEKIHIKSEYITKQDIEDLENSIARHEKELKPFQMQNLGVHRGNANTCASTIVANMYNEWNFHEFERISNEIYLLNLKRLKRDNDNELERKAKREENKNDRRN